MQKKKLLDSVAGIKNVTVRWESTSTAGRLPM